MISVDAAIERWELIEPFEIARGTITDLPVVMVTLTDEAGNVAHAEAAGVDYDGETPALILSQIEAVLPAVRDAAPGDVVSAHTLTALQELLPPGGARNALDCVLWDLRAKQSGIPAWKSAGLAHMRELTTVYTLGLGTEAETRRKAREARRYPLLKLKCDAERHVDVVRWVREEHPHARIAVDANQSWTRELLERVLPKLAALGVEMVEQPVRRYEDAQLDGLRSPLPLAADESCADRSSLPAIIGRYQYINIKLDKCGGLTEALAMSDDAIASGLQLMVGNMCGTSLGMAPAFLVGQRCGFVDLDGPLLQKLDRQHPLAHEDGVMQPPSPAIVGIDLTADIGNDIINIMSDIAAAPIVIEHRVSDPVVDAYKPGVDRSLLIENLRKTPRERFESLLSARRFILKVRQVGQEARDNAAASGAEVTEHDALRRNDHAATD